MYKNRKISTVECFKNENYNVYRKLFPGEQHFFKWIPAPENCKNQETNRIKSKKINKTLKLCTLTCQPLTPDQLIAENPKSSKQTFDLHHVTITISCNTQIRICAPFHGRL